MVLSAVTSDGDKGMYYMWILNHSFNRFFDNTESLRNETSLHERVNDSFKNADSFRSEWMLRDSVSVNCVVVLRSLHTESEMFACVFPFFSCSPSFPIKMHATGAKTQKIKPDPNFFWWTNVSEAVCKRDWHNVRSYLFFNVRKFRTKVCRDL